MGAFLIHLVTFPFSLPLADFRLVFALSGRSLRSPLLPPSPRCLAPLVPRSSSYIIAITTLHNLSTLQTNSRVVYSTGEAQFQISYQALVMKPLKGEVVDAMVEKAGKLGFFCRVGAMQVFVSGFVSRGYHYHFPLCLVSVGIWVAISRIGRDGQWVERMMTSKHRDNIISPIKTGGLM